MPDLSACLLELVRLASTDLPADVEQILSDAREREAGNSSAHSVMDTILKNVAIARQDATPVCQDTGTPIIRVRFPSTYSLNTLRSAIRTAVAEATSQSLLRPNAVEGLTGINSGNNLGGGHFPSIHFEEVEGDTLTVDLILKGGGCENVGRQYSLPDADLGAGRDLDGVRKAALDAVFRAQGQGCAPGFLGIAVGGDRGTSYIASKEVFFDPVGITHPEPEVAAMEQRITREANQLGIGPMGFGGKTTVLAARITGAHRLPASYFVSVSYMCWAFRRARMTLTHDQVVYNEYG
jgi:fumarate hydratase class I